MSDALPRGLSGAALACGIKAQGLDLGLLVADEAAPAAAVFTRSLLIGVHVRVGREQLARSGGLVRAVLVNSGNANCSTGAAGIDDHRRVVAGLARELDCPAEQVLFLSTGVIGARLPVGRVLDALPGLAGALACDAAENFARAIMTTDTVPKLAARTVGDARILGVAKGSGMIHPDMATMLAFLTTDARLPDDRDQLLATLCDRSFHRTTIDGDTSPNDTVLLWGTGRSAADDVAPALEATAVELARAIARDGEGATCLVTVRVTGAPDEAAATLVAKTIATSPLTKTAVHGRDPNWGRILSAAARAGVAFDPERARVWIGPGESAKTMAPSLRRSISPSGCRMSRPKASTTAFQLSVWGV